MVLRPVYHRFPSETLLLSVSFNSDGSRLAVTSTDRRVRVLDPRTGKILQVCLRSFRVYMPLSISQTKKQLLQVSRSNSHKANKVLYIGGLKMLLSTGSSAWNHRQIVLWDPVRQHSASNWANDWNVSWHFNWFSQFLCRMTCQSPCMKKIWMAPQEFCFLSMMLTLACSTWPERSYMLIYYNCISKKTLLLYYYYYVIGFWHRLIDYVSVLQGDGNIRYYELSTEKPYVNFLTEYRSLLPQKGLGEVNDSLVIGTRSDQPTKH